MVRLDRRCLSILFLACLVLKGCRSAGTFRLDSVAKNATLAPAIHTSVFTAADGNTADVYMTDLPPEVWSTFVEAPTEETASRLQAACGVIVHLHLFIAPRPGNTPIDDTASNLTIRLLVLSRGSVGLYGGGGFLAAHVSPKDTTFRGTIRKASMRPIKLAPTFSDRLGPSELNGSFSAKADPQMARELEALTRSLILALPK